MRHIDILVNNAAFTGMATMKSTPEIARREWELQFAVNVHGPFMLTKSFLPYSSDAGGVVVNLTSAVANMMPVRLPAFEGEPMRNPAYGVTKAAVNRMSNHLAAELASRHIAVIDLDPG